MNPGAQIANQKDNSNIQISILKEGQLKIILVRINQPAIIDGFIGSSMGSDCHEMPKLLRQRKVIVDWEPFQNLTPDRATGCHLTASAEPLMPELPPQPGWTPVLLAGEGFAKNAGSLTEPKNPRMRTQSKIKNRCAAVA